MARSDRRHLGVALCCALLACCTPSEKKSSPSEPAAAPSPVPPPPPAPAQPTAPEPAPAEPEKPALDIAAEPAPSEGAPPIQPDIYSGAHKLGVNRVTDMARVGVARFSKQGDELHLEGRVERGAHWLELRGRVESQSPSSFVLVGTIRGVPDMTWADEAPRERNTEGRFTFEIRKGRPYFRMYEVNGRACVCDDDCGNDFCYIDIEQLPIADDAQQIAK